MQQKYASGFGPVRDENFEVTQSEFVKRETLLNSLDLKARSDLMPLNGNLIKNLGKKCKPMGDTLPETLGDEDDVPDENSIGRFNKVKKVG